MAICQLKILQNLLVTITLVFLIVCCKSEDKTVKNTIGNNFSIVSVNELDNPFKFPEWKPQPCTYELIKDFDIEIKFHNKKLLENEEIKLIIVDDSTYYNGKFKEKIRIKKMKMCMDEQQDHFFSLMFGIVDKKNRRLYIWGIKENFDLAKVKKLKVELPWDNNNINSYSLSIENYE